jgi:hypothetical protein
MQGHFDGSLIFVDINIPQLQQKIKEILVDQGSIHHSIQDLKLKILEKFGKETRRRARIILSQSTHKTGYPAGGGGTDTRYGGVRIYDTITWKVYPNQNRVRVFAGGGIRPDAYMLNQPRGYLTPSANVSFISFTKLDKEGRPRRVKYPLVQREGIYYLGGAFRGVLRDLVKNTEKYLREIT